MSRVEQCGLIILNDENNAIYYDRKTKTFYVENGFSGNEELEADIPDSYYPKEDFETYNETFYEEFMRTFNTLGIIILDDVVITFLPEDDFSGRLRILNKKSLCDPIVVDYNLYGEYHG